MIIPDSSLSHYIQSKNDVYVERKMNQLSHHHVSRISVRSSLEQPGIVKIF